MAVSSDRINSFRVSSVLNRDVKNFGKKNLFDGKEDTCWNSEKGTPQWVKIEFKSEETVTGFRIQFQGGFAGRKCRVKWKSTTGVENDEEFYPEDNNTIQQFRISKQVSTSELTYQFEESTDFFGRIVIYLLEILSS